MKKFTIAAATVAAIASLTAGTASVQAGYTWDGAPPKHSVQAGYTWDGKIHRGPAQV